VTLKSKRAPITMMGRAKDLVFLLDSEWKVPYKLIIEVQPYGGMQ